MLAPMKRPTVASLKKVNAENLAGLGLERLASILVAVAESRPDVKRRLRMELAAAQGPDHLAVEIDRRLASLQTSRSKVSWRQRPTFVRDLDALRVLIAERLAVLDAAGALDRLWQFMDLARRLGSRLRDKDGEMAAVFARAAADIGRLIGEGHDAGHAQALADAAVREPMRWSDWLPIVLESSPPAFAEAALRLMSQRPGATPAWVPIIRRLADAAGNVDAFRSTFPAAALRLPAAAAEVGRRLLAAGRTEEAGAVLKAARTAAGKTAEPDFDWETVWIDYLDQAGEPAQAQAARWASFERTLSVARAKAFTQRLGDFDDVEAEGRAFDHAAGHPDPRLGLQFLMDWPALPEAARMVQTRAEDLILPADLAEYWAGRLRARHSEAARTLLLKAAAAALRQRQMALCERLTAEADTMAPT